MRRLIKYITAIVLCMTFTQCKDYLDVSSPSNVDDNFVTSTPSETLKTLSWCYANYRQNCIMGGYRWNDPIGSDAEMYPEEKSSNNLNAILLSDQLPVNSSMLGFNSLYSTLARAGKVASIIAGKDAYKADVAAGRVSDWTHLYGEAMTMKALCYFDLVKHFGDVPYGYENTLMDYSLTSRFDIYDNLITSLKGAESLMYKLGEGGITAERFSRTFCDALIGELALYSGGYQTIRTDVSDLYKNLSFDRKGTEQYSCVYARRSDYLDYYTIAEQYLQAAIDNSGTAHLITSDGRSYANNPFQRHFQYFADLQVSPESVFELGNIQGGATTATTSEYPYAFGRPSEGGTATAAPTKTFGALRIIPTVYYGSYENGDKRRDASVAVTGSKGDGNEMMLSFVPGNKSTGGISTNKWDENRMSPPYVTASRQSGMNWHVLRMADVMLMLAEVKAELGESGDAVNLVNQIRERAFGNATHDIVGLSGDALKDAVMEERKLELLGEGTRRWDLIRSGKFSEKAVAVRQEMVTMINDLKTQGYHQFANGNVISSYIWTKMVNLTNPLTYDAPNTTDPVLYPGWRGQYNYSTIATVSAKVVGTNHNVAIQGLFNYIDPAGATATALQSSGYAKKNWGIDIVNNATSYDRNILSGITSPNDPPRYYNPIPFETISKSKGQITNGYQLQQE